MQATDSSSAMKTGDDGVVLEIIVSTAPAGFTLPFIRYGFKLGIGL